jgi:Zn-dependent M16 (insulinase) family peptidase
MDEYLSEFGPSPESKPESEIVWQKKTITEPKWEKHAYPSGADQPETHMLNVNWLLNDRPFTPLEDLTVNILDHLLTGTTSSILRKTLTESGLGESITGGGLSDELLQATFSMGMKGVKPDDVQAVNDLVIDTLKKAAEEGFTDDASKYNVELFGFVFVPFDSGKCI